MKRGWSVNNSFIYNHECNHIDAFTDPALTDQSAWNMRIFRESVADMLVAQSGYNNLGVLFTLFSPAPLHCPSQWILPPLKGSWTKQEWNKAFELERVRKEEAEDG